MEFTSAALDTDVNDILLFTSYRGKLLLFNFNSTKEEYPNYRSALQRSMHSIRLK